MAMKLPNNRQLELLFYKLLNDALFLWLIVFASLLILEAAVPGYFSAFLSFTKMILAFFILVPLIAYFGKRIDAKFEFANTREILKNKTTIILMVLSLLLIINSVRNLAVVEIVIIAAAASAMLLSFYRIFILPEK